MDAPWEVKGEERKKAHTLVELLEAFELRGETTLAGGVDDEDDLALELRQVVDVALLCALLSAVVASLSPRPSPTVKGLELVERGSRRHGCWSLWCCRFSETEERPSGSVDVIGKRLVRK